MRLMVLGNWALQRGYDPRATAAWFRDCFVDGYDWVMVTNVVGMALYADGGRMATKPYAAGGAYLNRMTDHCRGCAYSPSVRVGPKACPFTAGYWEFLDRNAAVLRGNHRLCAAVCRPRPALRSRGAARRGGRTRRRSAVVVTAQSGRPRPRSSTGTAGGRSSSPIGRDHQRV